MSRIFLASTLAAASALALLAAPARAQPAGKDPYAADVYADEIIVIAPGVRRDDTGRRTSSGAPINELSTQRVVAFNDLDLRYDGDIRELRRRIHDAAVDACREIEASTAEPLLDSRSDCVRDAEQAGVEQINSIVIRG